MRRHLLLAVFLCVTAVFQAWFMDLSFVNIAPRHSRGTLTDLYVEGLAKGQSYLRVPTGGEASWESQKFHILDASYYRNRVYLYFGITPFAVLLVPWHLLTGTFLTDGACILIFCQIGYVFLGCSLLQIFREDRRARTDWLFAIGILTIIACSGTFSLIGRPAIYEVEGACGYACLAGAVACLVRGCSSNPAARAFLASAGLFAGLAMGCRPNCFPAVALIAAAIGYYSWRGEGSIQGKTKALLICWAPFAAVGACLAIWNYDRFSNIFEFGYSYMGFAVQNANLVHYSPGNFLFNLHRYLFGGFRLGPYFPFIEGTKDGPFPLATKTHEPVVQLYGSLLLFPILAYAVFAVRKRDRLGMLLLLASVANLFYLLGIGYGTYRYPSDYLGILSFVAAIGICGTPLISGAAVRFTANCLLVPFLLWSCISCICQASSIATTSNLFDVRRPRDFSLLSGPFNTVAFWIEGLSGSGPRAVRLTVMLPKGRTGQVEPILVAGDPGLQDFLYVFYQTPREIEVGFESMGNGGPVSGPMKIDYDRPHSVDISLGSFLPPDSHPLVAQLDKGELLMARNFVHVEIDGRPVLDDVVHVHPARARLFIGASPDDSAFGARFSGTLIKVERPLLSETGVYPIWGPLQFGPLAARLEMLPMPIGSRQPLVSVGHRPSGGVLFIETLASDKFRLGWQGYNENPIYSSPFDCTYGRPHRLEFDAGALLPPTASALWPTHVAIPDRQEEKLRFRCVLDGSEIWNVKHATPDVSPLSVRIGENGLLESNIAEEFNGELDGVSRLEF
jgi:hypothetical protein